MTSPTDSAVAPRATRKVVLQVLLGALTGGAAMSGMIWALKHQDGLLDDPARMAALGTAMVYALMAFIVGLGAAAPKVGSRALNVEDADELVEQRSDLLIGAGTFVLIAVLLSSLALAAGPNVAGLLAPSTAAIIAGVSGAALITMTIVFRNRGDEMMRAVSLEASSWALGFVFLLFASWSALAHLGMASAFPPLLFVAGFFALYLLAVFVAAGRRGMMKPR